MKESNRERKNDIKYKVTLNDEQKETKRLIRENQVVVVTGRAGCGKSLVSAVAALDFLNKKECEKIFVTRATVEVGHSLGFLPGSLDEKFNPYIEALVDNLNKCQDPVKTTQLISDGKLLGCTVQFIRGKTIDDVLIIEEAQNMTKHQMLALLTRLGKTGKIIINGDNEQKDIKDPYNGLSYAIDLAKRFPDKIKWMKLKENHRSDLVGLILDYEYSKK